MTGGETMEEGSSSTLKKRRMPESTFTRRGSLQVTH